MSKTTTEGARPYRWMRLGQLTRSLADICKLQEEDYGGGTSTEQTRELISRAERLAEENSQLRDCLYNERCPVHHVKMSGEECTCD